MPLFRAEISGQGNVHVEERALDQRTQNLSQLLAVDTGEDGFGDNVVNDLFKHQRIAADIPCRSETDARVDMADLFRLRKIAFVHFPREQLRPVAELLVTRMIHHLTRREITACFGRAGDTIIEFRQRTGRMSAYMMKYLWKVIIVRLVYIEKINAALVVYNLCFVRHHDLLH